MLVRFSVENFMSYKNPQVFSMVAGKQTKHGNHVISIKGKRLLKGSFFFGANAAGKSNLFEAIRFAQGLVRDGLQKNSLTNKHFRIEKEYAEKPGVFQFDIYSGGHFYSYGFAISYVNASVVEEWLIQCDTAKEVTIFERSIENGTLEIHSDYVFRDQEQKQAFNVFSKNVSDSKLFLSEIAERKLTEHKDFLAYKNVWLWIAKLIVITPQSKYIDKANVLTEDGKATNLAELLRDFDTGIEAIEKKQVKLEDALSFLPQENRAEIIQDIEQTFNQKDEKLGWPSAVEVAFGGQSFRFVKEDNQIFAFLLAMNHGNNDDLFQLADESDGTQRLFDLIPVYKAGTQARVILIDELDRSFHTKLVQKYIEQFYSMTHGIASQLIASVHDSNIMDLDLLRQDEIWFVERQLDHSSRIYSLNKYQVRFDKKVEKDYLLGRYGAIPCLTQLDILDEEGE